MTNNLTNTELQVAIDSLKERRHPPLKEHLDALLAEQRRRLNLPMAKPIKVTGLDENFNEVSETLNPPKPQPAVDEWEYVLAYWSEPADRLIKSKYNLADMSNLDLTLINRALMASRSNIYGIYKRPLNSGERWKLITFNRSGVLPETVEEIN